jgi:hypothetical protein
MSVDLFGDFHVVGLESKNQALNYLAEMVGELKTEIGKRPKQADPLTSVEYRTWDRRLMMKIGAVHGGIKMARAMGLITVEQSSIVLTEALAVVSRTMAGVDMGNF